jgi:hypothetical protein
MLPVIIVVAVVIIATFVVVVVVVVVRARIAQSVERWAMAWGSIPDRCKGFSSSP